MIKYGAARAIAFEPVPRNFDLLRLTVTANRLEDRVELHQLALSDTGAQPLWRCLQPTWAITGYDGSEPCTSSRLRVHGG